MCLGGPYCLLTLSLFLFLFALTWKDEPCDSKVFGSFSYVFNKTTCISELFYFRIFFSGHRHWVTITKPFPISIWDWISEKLWLGFFFFFYLAPEPVELHKASNLPFLLIINKWIYHIAATFRRIIFCFHSYVQTIKKYIEHLSCAGMLFKDRMTCAHPVLEKHSWSSRGDIVIKIRGIWSDTWWLLSSMCVVLGSFYLLRGGGEDTEEVTFDMDIKGWWVH